MVQRTFLVLLRRVADCPQNLRQTRIFSKNTKIQLSDSGNQLFELYNIAFTEKESSLKSCITFSYVSLVSFPLKQFLRLSLSLMTLTILNIIGQLFYRMYFSLSLFNIFSGYTSLVEILEKWCYVLFIVPYQIVYNFVISHY